MARVYVGDDGESFFKIVWESDSELVALDLEEERVGATKIRVRGDPERVAVAAPERVARA
jgi:hypothetical protein